jgi:hypothetical protein
MRKPLEDVLGLLLRCGEDEAEGVAEIFGRLSSTALLTAAVS